jgi:hypothetical protein
LFIASFPPISSASRFTDIGGACGAQIVKTLGIGRISAYRALDQILISTGAATDDVAARKWTGSGSCNAKMKAAR